MCSQYVFVTKVYWSQVDAGSGGENAVSILDDNGRIRDKSWASERQVRKVDYGIADDVRNIRVVAGRDRRTRGASAD